MNECVVYCTVVSDIDIIAKYRKLFLSLRIIQIMFLFVGTERNRSAPLEPK